jgi:hypothetical protein
MINLFYYKFIFAVIILLSITNTSYYLINHKTFRAENFPLRIKSPINENIKIKSKSAKWIIVTSINEPTLQINRLSSVDDFQLLVVADSKTNQAWSHKNTIFLNLADQNSLDYGILDEIPLNSYTRKNIGYLFAIENGARFIYDTDDDNSPIRSLSEYFVFEKSDYGLMFACSSSELINPYAHFGQPLIWPRGFPLTHVQNKHNNSYIAGKRKTSTIQQGGL